MTLTVGSLFAGIGGFDLGLERAGMEVRWQVENNEFCQHILNKHWPDVPCYGDIKEVKGERVEPVDVLCGGFPCQDISNAGKRAGIEGARSSLWKEYARLVGEIRPRYVLVENVASLRSRGLGVVLGDLAALGYDAEWDCIRASDFGAPHQRNRLWLVAYLSGDAYGLVADPGGLGGATGGASLHLAGAPGATEADGEQRQRSRDAVDDRGPVGAPRRRVFVADSGGPGLEGARAEGPATYDAQGTWNPWAVEPDVGRVADGIPARVDRLRSLGNALVPQIAQWIGERLVAHEAISSDRAEAA